jgi:outer membrane murein-binding lipoprotein Lpp
MSATRQKLADARTRVLSVALELGTLSLDMRRERHSVEAAERYAREAASQITNAIQAELDDDKFDGGVVIL